MKYSRGEWRGLENDLISRQEAIEWCLEGLNNIPSAQPEPCKDVPDTNVGDMISRQDAINLVKDVCDAIMSGCDSYYDSETGDEIYKDILEVDAILKCNKEIRIALRNMPSAQLEIVRCKDCKFYIPYDWMFDGLTRSSNRNDYSPDEIGCSVNDHNYPPEGFCSYAERRTDEAD